MAVVQRIENSTFNVSGSWTSINLSLTNHYYQRAFQSTKGVRASDSQSIGDFVRRVEDFRKSVKDLAEELRSTHRCPLEYEDLAKTLDELCATTIPYIFYFFVEAHSIGRSLGRQLQAEIAYMQIIMDEFSRKRTADRNRVAQHLMATNRLEVFLGLLWCYFSSLFYTTRLIPRIRQEMAASRLRIHALLFESVVRAHWGRRILAHQTDIDDFFGARWSLPQDLCLNRKVFLSILRFKFRGGPAEDLVNSEKFSILKQEGLEVIRPEQWEKAIKDGDGLQLSVRLRRQQPEQILDASAQRCPKCKGSDRTVAGSSENYMDCLRCNLSFNTKPLELEDHLEAAEEEGHTGREQTSDATETSEQPVFRFYSIVIVPVYPDKQALDHRAELRRTRPYPSLPKRHSLLREAPATAVRPTSLPKLSSPPPSLSSSGTHPAPNPVQSPSVIPSNALTRELPQDTARCEQRHSPTYDPQHDPPPQPGKNAASQAREGDLKDKTCLFAPPPASANDGNPADPEVEGRNHYASQHLRAGTSFDDRPFPNPYTPTLPSVPPSRRPSTDFHENPPPRDYYPYSAPVPPDGPYGAEQRSNTWRRAPQPESPPMRRPSDGGLNREPSYGSKYPRSPDDDPYSYEDRYPEFPSSKYDKFEHHPSPAIPIRQRPPFHGEDTSWQNRPSEPPGRPRDFGEYPSRGYDPYDRERKYRPHDDHWGREEKRGSDDHGNYEQPYHGPVQYSSEMVHSNLRDSYGLAKSPPSSYRNEHYYRLGGREYRQQYADDDDYDYLDNSYTRNYPDPTRYTRDYHRVRRSNFEREAAEVRIELFKDIRHQHGRTRYLEPPGSEDSQLTVSEDDTDDEWSRPSFIRMYPSSRQKQDWKVKEDPATKEEAGKRREARYQEEEKRRKDAVQQKKDLLDKLKKEREARTREHQAKQLRWKEEERQRIEAAERTRRVKQEEQHKEQEESTRKDEEMRRKSLNEVSGQNGGEQTRLNQREGYRIQEEQTQPQARERNLYRVGAQKLSSINGPHHAQGGVSPLSSLQRSAKPTVQIPTPAQPSNFGRHGQSVANQQGIQGRITHTLLPQFRQEQDEASLIPAAGGVGRMPATNDISVIYESHGRLWATIGSKPQLRWRDFPWPMFQTPTSAAEITANAINAYLQSPHYPVTAKVKIYKDRIRDQVRRWNLAHVEKQALPRVPDSQKEAVREAVRSVARVLHHLNSQANNQLVVPMTAFPVST